MSRKVVGIRACVRACIMSGLPTHLVQELNVGTVSLLIVLVCRLF